MAPATRPRDAGDTPGRDAQTHRSLSSHCLARAAHSAPLRGRRGVIFDLRTYVSRWAIHYAAVTVRVDFLRRADVHFLFGPPPFVPNWGSNEAAVHRALRGLA